MHKQVDLDDRPRWWIVCDAHVDPTPLGGLGSAWNDPWPRRQAEHEKLAARVLGARHTPASPLTPGGGLYAIARSEVRKRRGWRTYDHVSIVDGLLIAECPTCNRRVEVATADVRIDGASLRLGDDLIPSGSTITTSRLVGPAR